MTHNESVKTFDDIVRHLELEVKRLVVIRPNEQAYVVESSSRKTSCFKHNRKFFKKNKKSDDALKKGKTRTHKKFKHVKRDKSKLKCYNYLVATDHITRNERAYVEFWRISSDTRWIYVGNNSKVEVKGIRTYFPRMGEIDRDLHLYKIIDPDIRSTLEQQLMLEPSGNELIERKVHIVTQYDEIELKSILEALTCPTKDVWRKTMEEELESMRKNQV
ncbi:hypothetical protein AAG906_003217 [Vitis piasezkii]